MSLFRATWFINNPLHFVNFYCHINNSDWDSQWLCLITYTKHYNKHKYILEIYGKSSSKTKREFHGVLSGIWFHLISRDYTWESSIFHWAFLYLALHALVCKVLGKSFHSTYVKNPFEHLCNDSFKNALVCENFLFCIKLLTWLRLIVSHWIHYEMNNFLVIDKEM